MDDAQQFMEGNLITWAILAAGLRKAGYFIYDHWQIFGIAMLVALIFSCGFCSGFRSCTPAPAPPIDIEGENSNINALDANRNKANIEAINANQKANEAATNFNNILSVDTNKRESNFGAVKRKFCADHPADSKCR